MTRPFPIRGLLALLLAAYLPAAATVFGNVRGVVHDPQHHPVAGAQITLQAADSQYKQTIATSNDGEFYFDAVPLGKYTVTVDASGFTTQSQALTVVSGSAPVLHYALALAGAKEEVTVTASPEAVDPDSPRRDILISQKQIFQYAGVDSSTSFKMITNFVPGSYMVHDQLHVRGGHQVTWAIDGVPVPNTAIASSVGPQFNPKDISYLQAETGSYAAEYGDRIYGLFNVAPNSGFERNREAELIAGYGNYNQTDDWLSFGDHTEKFAYYVSGSGNSTEWGLEPPTPVNLHNQAQGGGAFTSLLYNPNSKDQLRFVAGLRLDYYQVPNTPDMQAAGVDDREREQDIFSTFTWAHSYSPGLSLIVSPFYHFNRTAYEGGLSDVPIATDNRASNYEGGQITLAAINQRNNARVGLYAFAQQDNSFFSVIANDGSGDQFSQRVFPGGNLEALFLEDQFKATRWLTLSGGIRLTHFAGELNENAADPRLGVSIQLPKLNWVLRAAYSYFYQPPPLDTVSGPLVQFAASQGFTFLPLQGERDIQQEYGIAIPFHGWTLSETYFHTGAQNYFDHDALGNSNIFLPLTIQAGRVEGFETTLRSPLLLHRFRAHAVYSNQTVQGFGAVTGGLTDFTPPPQGGYFLDHDQRNTFSAGAEGDLPWRSFAGITFNYGSGFLNGDGPNHLPSYYTFDLSVGKNFGESFTARLVSTNIGNNRYQIDNSNTFGGTHWADPRMIGLQIRYRFRY
ncbi:MAG TPA: TonB-dependent receptor [Terriglobales bacterium]|nr:TonB-dependent receptor [Terriglobales bacterium]